jgi:hypothetical protein
MIETDQERPAVQTQPFQTIRTARYGLRVPPPGAPIPFRVLISTRWLWAGALTALTALLGLIRLSRPHRLPLLLGGAGLGLATLALGVLQARLLKRERVTIPVTGLPAALDGLTIAQLSHLHLGSPFTVENVREAVAWVRERQPDLIVLTGDFVSVTSQIPLLHDALRDLHAPYGVYGIFGNHDYWTELPLLEQTLRGLGIDLLRNEQRLLSIGGATLALVGVDCVWERQHDLTRALANLPSDAVTVALAHEPDIADEIAPYGVALQLSGHTHAGHIAAPWLGPLFLPRHGFRYFRGLQRVGGMWLYVSRGLGGIPLRLGSPLEVTEFTLRSA